MTQKHRKWSQGHVHRVLLCVANTGVHSSILLWVASLACILKVYTGALESRIICSSILINIFELAETLLQEKVVQYIAKDICSLLLDTRPSRRLSDRTEGEETLVLGLILKLPTIKMVDSTTSFILMRSNKPTILTKT